MRFTSAVRIVGNRLQDNGLRGAYWGVTKIADEARLLVRKADPAVRAHFLRDLRRFLTADVRPIRGEVIERVQAAADWLLRSQAANTDGGVSLGYFPCDGEANGWRASYPETTGYIMTTMLNVARRFAAPKYRHAALRMGYWEIAIQMASGAVQGGPVVAPDKQTAAAFNTGMVLDGLCSALPETDDVAFVEAARRAADFLENDIDEAGYFRTSGQFVSAGEIKTYNCLCAWAMYRFGELVGEPRYLQSATRCVEAAVRSQHANGWFPHNDLSHSRSPLTHTIGYTLQGMLEVGVIAERPDFIDAARRGVEPLMKRIDKAGFLAGRFYSDWRPATFSSCLTGSAQIAIVCYRLSQITGDSEFRHSADRLVDFLKALQALDSTNEAINGALAGSFPIMGEYMRGGYPNWATKYFVDALMLQDAAAAANRANPF